MIQTKLEIIMNPSWIVQNNMEDLRKHYIPKTFANSKFYATI